MPQFWLGVCSFDGTQDPEPPAGNPLLTDGARRFAVEIVREGDEMAVLLSTVEDTQAGDLRCRIGFASVAKTCSIWADEGFPLVDAIIEYDGKKVTVRSPCFARQFGAMEYGQELLSLDNIEFATATGPGAAVGGCYRQWLQVPDDGLPATLVERKAIDWKPTRSQVTVSKATDVVLKIEESRLPGFLPFRTGTQTFDSVWTGRLEVDVKAGVPGSSIREVKREDVFGLPAFRFEDVEVIGFRMDLAPLGAGSRAALAALVEPLNFHLEQPAEGGSRDAPLDFEYRVATTTVVIELLRYGRMKLRTPLAPLEVKDYQSQHELVVRILVGRVDDDTSQAHSPAIFVPAIFVDNPWSKVVGRGLQGFDKWMATFCAARDDAALEPLRPDGRPIARPGDEVVPLTHVTEIQVADSLGAVNGNTILEFDYPEGEIRDLDAFNEVDLDLAMGRTALAGARWRQTDFEAAEFRRSFARSANFKTLKGFRSIQVSPVADGRFAKTWITGTFAVDDDLRIALPKAVVGLKLHCREQSPKGWKQLCNVLGLTSGQSRRVSFAANSWYRLKCSMSLDIDNGLDPGT